MNRQCSPTELSPTAPPIDPLWVLPLEQLQSQTRSMIGGKALSWALLHQQGYRVPDGFCISARAYRYATKPGSRARIPTDLADRLLASFTQLTALYPAARFAVRSSATEEDASEASWAGIFKSYLGIENAEQFLNAVTACFNALNSDAARLYRSHLQRSDPQHQPAMAVMVQVQIEADIAGILFTRDPSNGCSKRLCINSIAGAGEALASGETSGDHYWLAPDNRILEQRLAGHSPLLNRALLRQLADDARRLDQHQQRGLDLEFACLDQQIWWLQARPITTGTASDTPENSPIQRYLKQETHRLRVKLKQLQNQGTLKAGAGVLSNGNISELLPSPTPMSFALFKQIFAGPGGAIPRGRRVLGYDTDEQACEALFELVAGQPYFHLELDARTYDQAYRQPVEQFIAAVKTDPSRANYPEFGLYQQFMTPTEASELFGKKEGAARCAASRVFQSRMRLQGRHQLRQLNGWVETYLQNNLVQQRKKDLAKLNEPQLVIQINAWITHLRRISCCHFVIAARLGFYFAESLRFQLTEVMGDAATPLLSSLLQALPGSRINQQCFDLQALQTGAISTQTYLERYGHLSSNELELSLPRLDEDASAIDRLLAATGPENPTERFNDQLRQRKHAEQVLRQRLSTLDADSRQPIWQDYRMARRFLPLRETIKYYYAGEYALIRTALLELADRVGFSAEEIFYLRPAELPLCLKDPRPLRNRIQQRQSAHQVVKQIAAHHPLPNVILGDNIDLSPPAPSNNEDDDTHRGHPISPGLRRGRVRLLDESHTDLQRLIDELNGDDIIVTRSVNLGLAPLLRKVAGLIVEVGGFLAHGACQAREAGIPAMVLPGASLRLKNNSEAWIDGSEGVLRVLRP